MDKRIVDFIIKRALEEDKVDKDITSHFLFPKNKIVEAEIVAKDEGIIAGLDIAKRVFYLLDRKIRFKKLTSDGEKVKRGEQVALIRGDLKKILAGERTALNFLMRLSGIATLTRRFVERVYPYKVKIMDTRKTTPGLRILEKYAIKVGGGFNHRMDLSELVLIKDNHLKEIDFLDLQKRLEKIKRKKIEIEIEVKNIENFKKILSLKPDIVMLDNMRPEEVRRAVEIRNSLSKTKNPQLEVSGEINLKNVRTYASTGIERISIGLLTHSYKSLDFSLEIL